MGNIKNVDPQTLVVPREGVSWATRHRVKVMIREADLHLLGVMIAAYRLGLLTLDPEAEKILHSRGREYKTFLDECREDLLGVATGDPMASGASHISGGHALHDHLWLDENLRDLSNVSPAVRGELAEALPAILREAAESFFLERREELDLRSADRDPFVAKEWAALGMGALYAAGAALAGMSVEAFTPLATATISLGAVSAVISGFTAGVSAQRARLSGFRRAGITRADARNENYERNGDPRRATWAALAPSNSSTPVPAKKVRRSLILGQ